MKNNEQMEARELHEIMTSQLRELHNVNINDKNIARKIDLAKQIFNGAGKMIALSAYVSEANRTGNNGLLNEAPTKQITAKK